MTRGQKFYIVRQKVDLHDGNMYVTIQDARLAAQSMTQTSGIDTFVFEAKHLCESIPRQSCRSAQTNFITLTDKGVAL